MRIRNDFWLKYIRYVWEMSYIMNKMRIKCVCMPPSEHACVFHCKKRCMFSWPVLSAWLTLIANPRAFVRGFSFDRSGYSRPLQLITTITGAAWEELRGPNTSWTVVEISRAMLMLYEERNSRSVTTAWLRSPIELQADITHRCSSSCSVTTEKLNASAWAA